MVKYCDDMLMNEYEAVKSETQCISNESKKEYYYNLYVEAKSKPKP